MEHLVDEAGFGDHIVVESAGTGGWHVGDGPDRRAVAEARRRGIAMRHTARQFTRADFARFDQVLAMDDDNRRDLVAIAPDAASAAKVRMLLSFDPDSEPGAAVPDPYYGGPDGFAHVFDLVERACRGLLGSLER